MIPAHLYSSCVFCFLKLELFSSQILALTHASKWRILGVFFSGWNYGRTCFWTILPTMGGDEESQGSRSTPLADEAFYGIKATGMDVNDLKRISSEN
ncbi:hypothetical protein Ancab_000407 [Ancistrocladus abbreviatus]